MRDFSLTHVQYEEGDRLGFLLALVSQTPVFVMVSYAVLLCSRRDLATAALATGQLLNEVVNYVLKHAIRQPRPAHVHAHAGSLPKWGMPSDHAQFVGFAAGYLTLWALRRWSVGRAWRGGVALAVHLGAGAVMFSRVYLGYHTVDQVVAGYCVGLGLGAAWHAVTEAYLRPRFASVTRWSVARALLVRDCSDVNVLQAEYAAVTATRPRQKH